MIRSKPAPLGCQYNCTLKAALYKGLQTYLLRFSCLLSFSCHSHTPTASSSLQTKTLNPVGHETLSAVHTRIIMVTALLSATGEQLKNHLLTTTGFRERNHLILSHSKISVLPHKHIAIRCRENTQQYHS